MRGARPRVATQLSHNPRRVTLSYMKSVLLPMMLTRFSGRTSDISGVAFFILARPAISDSPAEEAGSANPLASMFRAALTLLLRSLPQSGHLNLSLFLFYRRIKLRHPTPTARHRGVRGIDANHRHTGSLRLVCQDLREFSPRLLQNRPIDCRLY